MKKRRLNHCLILLLLISSLGLGGGVASAHSTTAHSAAARPARPTAASSQVFSPDGDPLLLVHGFNDTCQYAFNETDEVPNTGLNAITTEQYLRSHGWNTQLQSIGSIPPLDDIGYYNPGTPFTEYLYNGGSVTTYDNTCDHNLQTPQNSSDWNAQSSCSSLLGGNAAGTDNDPIEHLGCLLAWYIYDNYAGQPVDILAHSMGGLIVRDAIGESGHDTANSSMFPPSPLNVHIVVTVGTPHGGVYGGYLNLAGLIDGSPRELVDMDPASVFMHLLGTTPLLKPQGTFGTYWALMASSVPCSLSTQNGVLGTGGVACYVHSTGMNDPFPDGDGVVQADSALAMPADFKILYGKGLFCPTGTCSPTGGSLFDSGGLQYSHEANTCTNFALPPPDNKPLCLSQPFYLNDGTSGSTQAWICNVGCTNGSPGPGNGGMADMGIVINGGTPPTGQPVLFSLAEIVALLESQGSGTYVPSNCNPSTTGAVHSVSGDFTGDGKTDVVSFYNYGNNQIKAWLFPGTSAPTWSNITQIWDPGVNYWDWNCITFLAGDFNGDGKADIMAIYNQGGANTAFWLFKGATNGIASPVMVWNSGVGSFDWNRAKFVAGDFNGDGKADIVAFYDYGNAQTKAWLWPGTSASTWSSVSTVWDSGVGNFDWNQAKFVAGDFTGDGRADIVAIYNYGNAQTKFWLFPGTSAPTWSNVTLVWDSGVGNFDWNQARCAAGDFDEDGLADIACFYNYGGAETKAWLFRPTSTSWSASLAWDSGVGNFDWNQARFFAGDFNGDGHVDIVSFYNYGNAETKAWLFQATSTPWNASPVWDSGPNDWDWNRM